jgi:hypothetical protein
LIDPRTNGSTREPGVEARTETPKLTIGRSTSME